MPTPHIEAKVGEIAPIVITAGDPKRCQYIANKYLKNAKIVGIMAGASTPQCSIDEVIEMVKNT